MVRNMRKAHDSAFKARVALEAIKGEGTLAQLSSEFGVHANQICQWRKQVLKELPNLFPTAPKSKFLSLITEQKVGRGGSGYTRLHRRPAFPLATKRYEKDIRLFG